jgi:DNA repair exonuclease SbcCD ATPase subunit
MRSNERISEQREKQNQQLKSLEGRVKEYRQQAENMGTALQSDPVDEQVKKEGFMDKVKAFFASLVAGIKSFFSGSEDIQPQSTKSNSAEPDNQQEQTKQQEAQAAKAVNSSKQQGHKGNETVMEAAEGRSNKLGGLAGESADLAKNSEKLAKLATQLKEREEARSTFPSLSGVAKAIVGFFQGKGQGPRSK